jgi:histidinol-phosphate aminotransferase
VSCDYVELALPGVRALRPYQPGKPIEELERELGVSNTLKLASNENPLGPSPRAVEALATQLDGLALYPDGSGHRLKQMLAERLGVRPAQVTLGNGSNEILELVARAYLSPEFEAVFSEHAFAVYPLVTQATGATARVTPANPPDHAQPYGSDLEAMAAAIGPATRVVFVANPNNPTGTWLSAQALERFIERVPPEVLIVLDEAYCEYVDEADYPDALAWLGAYPNLIVTRTFSKIHGLAGLRIGYGISGAAVADVLNRVRQPFNTNSLAQVAACAALTDSAHVELSAHTNAEGLRQFAAAFEARGLGYIPSVANFISVDVGREAAPVYEALLREAVIVRPVANYGLPRHLRITVGRAEENQRVIEALDRVLAA